MENSYVYDWLDKMSNYDLNPMYVYPGTIGKSEAERLSVLILQEIENVEGKLKELFFLERKGNQLSLLVQKYHDMLIVIMDKVHLHLENQKIKTTGLKNILFLFLTKLEGLLLFFEVHFTSFIGKEFRVPQTKLLLIKDKILVKLDALEKVLENNNDNAQLFKVIKSILQEFVSRIDNRKHISIREVKYHCMIIDDVLKSLHIDQPLREMVIYRNLNSKESINFFIKTLELSLELLGTSEEKLDCLRSEYKLLQQMPETSNLIYDPDFPGLKEYLRDYLKSEIFYLEQKTDVLKSTDGKSIAVPNFKVMCNLSTDQIAIILRAADDTRLLISKSLNAVFKAIVPYLSTPNKKDVNWQSVRTKSYDSEQRDKQIAITALEEMIKRIRDY